MANLGMANLGGAQQQNDDDNDDNDDDDDDDDDNNLPQAVGCAWDVSSDSEGTSRD